MVWPGNLRHGHAARGHRSPEFRAWDSARQRCNNPRNRGWVHYGGRGIKVCSRWDRPDGLVAFVEDMGLRPGPKYTLDRIDNDGDYTPENCRWVTRSRQQRNTRQTIWVTINGNTKPVPDWCEIFRIGNMNVLNRIRIGWDPIRALVTPVRPTPKLRKPRKRRTHG